MTGREKIEAALSGEGSPQVPVVLPYEGIFIRDHWEEVIHLPWWYWDSPKFEHQIAWREEAIRALGQDWFLLPFFLSRADREELEIIPREVSLRNRRTGERRELKRPAVGGESIIPGFPGRTVTTPEDVEYAVPLPEEGGRESGRYPRGEKGRDDLARALLQGKGLHLFPFVQVMSPFWNCFKLWNYEELLLRSVETPELIRYACSRYVKVSQERIRRAAAMGAAGVWIEECLTDLLHPDSFTSLSLPYVQTLFEEVRGLGLKSLYYYTGNPKRKLDAIFSTGADAYSFEEKKKGYMTGIGDLAEYLSGHGNRSGALLGNIDPISLLQEGSGEMLEAAIREQLKAAEKMQFRFIMSLGSPVTPGTSLERVKRFCSMTRELSLMTSKKTSSEEENT